jgi:hypothetical protein
MERQKLMTEVNFWVLLGWSGQMLAFVATAIGGWIALRQTRRNIAVTRETVAETKQIAIETHDSLNSRVDALIELTRKLAFSEGRLDRQREYEEATGSHRP